MCMGVATANSVLVISFARERYEALGDPVQAARAYQHAMQLQPSDVGYVLLARALRGVLPETDVRFDVVPGSLHGGPAFETEENMARVFAFLSAALAPAV